MERFSLFQSFLNKFIPLDEETFNAVILPYIQVRQFKKKEVVTKAGEVENYINFIEKGLVRKYFIHNGNEVITQLSLEGQIIFSQDSFHSQTPSDYFLETIEASTLLSIKYDDLNTIFSTNAAMERLGRLIVTYVMVLNDRWQISLLKATPRERFLSFIGTHPELMQRVPQKFLASLLNIQPETFSRFKHLLKEEELKKDGRRPAL